jgi:cobalt-zinc-cadmium efflux system membrane fusion protein
MPVRIELPNTDRALRPGMTASAQVPLANTLGRVLSVPAPALQRLADAWVVFIPRGDDEWHFEVRTVGRGRDLGAAVEILSGLAVGDRVVVDGSFVLKAEAEKARGGAVAAHTH